MNLLDLSLFLFSSQGILRLREAIAKNHAERDSLHFDVDNIVVGPGSKELIFLVMNVFNGGMYC